MNAVKSKIDFLIIVFLFSLTAVGGYYEEISCVLSVLLSVCIFIAAKKNKCIDIKLDLMFISVLIIVGGYLLSALWAVDKGTAFLGFIKFLPLPLFAVAVSQKEEERENILNIMPYFAAVITVITALLMQIPVLKSYFSVADRFAGCFEYPNTFAAFLLVSELLLISKPEVKFTDFIISAVLLGGILYTGSRTVFVLFLLSNVAVLLLGKNKKAKTVFLGICAVIIIIAAVITLISGANVFGRFLSISLKESTFVGRILYFRDALPVIFKHPFGLGYGGYYYIQQSIQTGVYSVRHVHNDFLQLALDIGWIPTLAAVVTLVSTVLRKTVTPQRKVILLTLFLHSCFDFNLQYVSMCFILILFTDTKVFKTFEIKSLPLTAVLLSVFSLLSIYFGAVFVSYRISANSFSQKLYPYYTDNNIELLKQCETAEDMKAQAETVFAGNKYVSLSYSAKAKVAYSKGKFKEVIENKHKVFEYAPFSYNDYEEYCYMLINGITLYTRDGDTYSADFCKKELLDTYSRLQDLPKRLSYLGTLINDTPKTELPEEIVDYITNLTEKAK